MAVVRSGIDEAAIYCWYHDTGIDEVVISAADIGIDKVTIYWWYWY